MKKVKATPEVSLPLVCVEWVDASSWAGWAAEDAWRDGPVVCWTHGLLVGNAKGALVLAQTLTQDGVIGAPWRIPIECVKRVNKKCGGHKLPGRIE